MTTTQLERVDSPPREELLREAPFALLRASDTTDPGDGLTLDGWAAVFGRETLIDSWEGRFFESLAPGSMKKSFRERTPRVQFDHGRHPLVGSIPIASVQDVREGTDPELAPDGGAHVTARLHDNWLIEPVRDAIASGSIDGMSFRFTVIREEWRDAEGKVIRDPEDLMAALRRSWFEDIPEEELLHRTLKEVKVPELGPVVWPAYEETSVAVRSRTVIDLGAIRDTEDLLEAEAALAARREALRKALGSGQSLQEALAGDTDAPPDPGHPSTSRADDAPPDGHPSDATDAPPPGGHPSSTPTPSDELRAEMRDATAGPMAEIAAVGRAKHVELFPHEPLPTQEGAP